MPDAWPEESSFRRVDPASTDLAPSSSPGVPSNPWQSVPVLPPAATEPFRAEAAPHTPIQWRLPLLLFLLTTLTTLMAGAFLVHVNPLSSPLAILAGLPFSVTLLTILLVHEMGHYLTARHYHIQATLPYFIPAPPLIFIIGTFGAFIRMKSPIVERKALLEVGAAGPIAGFLVAVPATIIGLRWSTIDSQGIGGPMVLGEPLMLQLLTHWLLSIPQGAVLLLHPVALAGWFGLFVTSLNLLPIGQLDGGHIGYAVFGERQRYISLTMVGILIGLGLLGWKGWLLWAMLAAVIGIGHPPIIDAHVPLTFRQKVIAWLSLIIFLITFIPSPISILGT
ncbi:MAG TPA: site-2 protease family protein [Nitrospiria bacterium]|nr:site-2 protease family protein [Nitrospiria bacterium]